MAGPACFQSLFVHTRDIITACFTASEALPWQLQFRAASSIYEVVSASPKTRHAFNHGLEARRRRMPAAFPPASGMMSTPCSLKSPACGRGGGRGGLRGGPLSGQGRG